MTDIIEETGTDQRIRKRIEKEETHITTLKNEIKQREYTILALKETLHPPTQTKRGY